MILKNKVIVVTGGAGLIGKAFVSAIAKHSGIPIVAEIDEGRANLVVNEISGSYYYNLDINNPESVARIIEWCHLKFGRIDAVVNNAYPRNKNYGRHFFDVQHSDFCENLSLNLGGYFLVMQQFAKYFEKQGYGNIINISSIYGVVAPRFSIYENTSMTTPVEYAAIKSAVTHLTKYVAAYLRGTNIRVNCLTPGGVLDSQPEEFLKKYRSFCSNKGMLNPDDLVGGLVFLLSDESRMIHGQNMVIDDGFTL